MFAGQRFGGALSVCFGGLVWPLIGLEGQGFGGDVPDCLAGWRVLGLVAIGSLWFSSGVGPDLSGLIFEVAAIDLKLDWSRMWRVWAKLDDESG